MREVLGVQEDEGRLRVMCSNHSSRWYMNLCQKYPENLGWIIGPRHWKNPRPGVAFALDNDAFQSFTNGTPYDFAAWEKFIAKVCATGLTPLWALVPDVVGDRDKTLDQWGMFHAVIKDSCGWPTALAVQDGMAVEDVRQCNPDVVFVGGTTGWKWKTAHVWCENFPRVHVGRVRSRRLPYCQQIGAESCDGTGWFRESVRGKPARQLEAWLENPQPHPELGLEKSSLSC